MKTLSGNRSVALGTIALKGVFCAENLQSVVIIIIVITIFIVIIIIIILLLFCFALKSWDEFFGSMAEACLLVFPCQTPLRYDCKP